MYHLFLKTDPLTIFLYKIESDNFIVIQQINKQLITVQKMANCLVLKKNIIPSTWNLYAT